MGVTNVTELAKTVADSTLYFLCLFFFANFRFALLLKKYNDGFCCLFDPVYKNYCAAKTALTRKPKLPYKKMYKRAAQRCSPLLFSPDKK
jgi:hypothetical protein